MDSSPEASQLVLLSQLPNLTLSTKVRFLGCVDNYNNSAGVLVLKERFPARSDAPLAAVDVANVLDSLNPELTQVGAWVNVVGYLQQTGGITGLSGRGMAHLNAVAVNAVMVWTAGAIKVDAYEVAVKDLQATGSG